jgi:hypothetical protein
MIEPWWHEPWWVRILKIIDELEKAACSCDIMNGYICSIHEKCKELRNVVEYNT